MMMNIFFMGLFFLTLYINKVFLILFSIEVLSFSILVFFSYNVKSSFIISLLLVVSGGLILTLLSLQFLFLYNKNYVLSYIK